MGRIALYSSIEQIIYLINKYYSCSFDLCHNTINNNMYTFRLLCMFSGKNDETLLFVAAQALQHNGSQPVFHWAYLQLDHFIEIRKMSVLNKFILFINAYTTDKTNLHILYVIIHFFKSQNRVILYY